VVVPGDGDATAYLDGNRAALDELFRGDGYAGRLGAELLAWGGGWSRVAARVDDDHRNFAGWLHGGVTFGVGDVAFSVASNSWGRLSVALAVDVQFLGSAEPGEVLVAEGRERHRTTRTAAYLIEVHAVDADTDLHALGDGPAELPGRLVGSLHAMVHRTGRWLLDEEAWSPAWRETH
jgi:acyl-CoA thioesterase